MKKQIPKPENWQDFESLCKKLWGEIWEIPYKIKKNGRSGQSQNGVDIYGIPKGELDHYGVQCKGKDEYTHAKLTKSEIDQEVQKARGFKPNLKAFIIATTSNKDSEIEEYIRILDVENRNNGSFEIILFCWEDIADLIEENRNTFQYYVNNNQFRYKFDFDVFSEDGKKEITLEPTFCRKVKIYRMKKIENKLLEDLITSNQFPIFRHPISKFNNPNHAICEFRVLMKNTGSVVIENWRVIFNILGEHKEIKDSKYYSPGMLNFSFDTKKREIVKKSKCEYRSNVKMPLIQSDTRYSTIIKIIPLPKEYSLTLNWELRAKDFQKSGKLIIKIKPKYKDESEIIFVDDKSELKEMEIISIRENEYEIREDEKDAYV